MAALNIGFLWLLISGIVGSVIGHLTHEEIGRWTGSILFFGGLAVAVFSALSSRSSSAGYLGDVPVHHDVIGSQNSD